MTDTLHTIQFDDGNVVTVSDGELLALLGIGAVDRPKPAFSRGQILAKLAELNMKSEAATVEQPAVAAEEAPYQEPPPAA